MGKGKQSAKNKTASTPVESQPVDTEMEQVKNSIEFQTRSLDRLKTIRTGKRKILDIFRQSGDQLDKKLMEQLHQRYNEFVCQETEILELLRRTMGFNGSNNGSEGDKEADAAVNDLCAQIAETNARLTQAKQKNDKLEREAVKRSINVKEVEEQRDALQNRVRSIQEENVQKKQTVLKLLSVLRDNPEILDKNQKAGNPEPGFSCIQSAQSTPGTSQEYEEISKHLESIKARRARMNAIRERLGQASAAQKMDDTYQSAVKRLEALSAIRKTLEETTAADAAEAETNQSEKKDEPEKAKLPVDVKPPLTSTTSVQLVTDSDDEEEEHDEEEVDKLLLDEVRREFLSRFENAPHSSAFLSTNPPPLPILQCNCKCSELSSHLERIEEQVALQNHRLTALYDQVAKRSASKEPVDDETKRAAVISELNSPRGKLQKQRTLERVRIFANSGTTSFDKTVEEVDSNGVEKEICLIIEHVVPWLNKHENEKVATSLVTELRELIIGHANKICFPAGVNSDLFNTQLTTILDDAILQYADDSFKKAHNAIVSEVSEILYNELTFFKLINNIESMEVEDD